VSETGDEFAGTAQRSTKPARAPSPRRGRALACIAFLRSPASKVFGLRWKMRRHHGTLTAGIAIARLVPQRRQNLRVESFGSPHVMQIRSPGWATRVGVSAVGLGRGVTTAAVGRRAAGWLG